MSVLDRRSFLIAAAGAGTAATVSAARTRRRVPAPAGRIRLGAPVSIEGDDPEALARACRAKGYRAAYCPKEPLAARGETPRH